MPRNKEFILIAFDCGMGKEAEEKVQSFIRIVTDHLEKLDNRNDMNVNFDYLVDDLGFANQDKSDEEIMIETESIVPVIVTHIV